MLTHSMQWIPLRKEFFNWHVIRLPGITDAEAAADAAGQLKTNAAAMAAAGTARAAAEPGAAAGEMMTAARAAQIPAAPAVRTAEAAAVPVTRTAEVIAAPAVRTVEAAAAPAIPAAGPALISAAPGNPAADMGEISSAGIIAFLSIAVRAGRLSRCAAARADAMIRVRTAARMDAVTRNAAASGRCTVSLLRWAV